MNISHFQGSAFLGVMHKFLVLQASSVAEVETFKLSFSPAPSLPPARNLGGASILSTNQLSDDFEKAVKASTKSYAHCELSMRLNDELLSPAGEKVDELRLVANVEKRRRKGSGTLANARWDIRVEEKLVPDHLFQAFRDIIFSNVRDNLVETKGKADNTRSYLEWTIAEIQDGPHKQRPGVFVRDRKDERRIFSPPFHKKDKGQSWIGYVEVMQCEPLVVTTETISEFTDTFEIGFSDDISNSDSSASSRSPKSESSPMRLGGTTRAVAVVATNEGWPHFTKVTKFALCWNILTGLFLVASVPLVIFLPGLGLAIVVLVVAFGRMVINQLTSYAHKKDGCVRNGNNNWRCAAPNRWDVLRFCVDIASFVLGVAALAVNGVSALTQFFEQKVGNPELVVVRAPVEGGPVVRAPVVTVETVVRAPVVGASATITAHELHQNRKWYQHLLFHRGKKETEVENFETAKVQGLKDIFEKQGKELVGDAGVGLREKLRKEWEMDHSALSENAQKLLETAQTQTETVRRSEGYKLSEADLKDVLDRVAHEHIDIVEDEHPSAAPLPRHPSPAHQGMLQHPHAPQESESEAQRRSFRGSTRSIQPTMPGGHTLSLNALPPLPPPPPPR